jgi:hypothetical protein
MKPSLLAYCVKEKYCYDTHEDEHGFFCYSSDGSFMIREFYIKPESRPSIKIFLDYSKIMDQAARDKGFSEVYISIFMGAKNNLRENTLALALRCGFKLDRLGPEHIYLKRGC